MGKTKMSADERADVLGWSFTWEFDREEYQMGDLETEHPGEVLCCALRDSDGRVLTSLGGIDDPSDEYAREIETELLDEVLTMGPAVFRDGQWVVIIGNNGEYRTGPR